MIIAATVLLLAFGSVAQAQDVRAIQIREAQKADERTIAYYGRFRAALTEKFGNDPLLSMLVFSENEATALVHSKPSAPAQFVIFQEGKWIDTDGRELKPWAPNADPAVAQFRLSRVTDTFLRERFRAHRAQAARATDHLSPVKVGYFGKPFDRLILEYQVLSMTRFGFSSAAFDLATGASLDVNAAIEGARAERKEAARKEEIEAKAAAKRDLRKEVPATLAAFRRDAGPARLMAVWIAKDKITFVRADKAIVDYDQRGRFVKRKEPYDSIWLCTEGFDDREVDWSGFAALVEKALLAGNLDEEDRDHAAIAVERPRECAPTLIEVKFTNYKAPQPYVTFDAAGRLSKR
jgi:hypothetical protein